LAKLPDDVSGVVRDIWLLRLRALLAQSRGDESGLPRISAAVSRDGDVTHSRGICSGPRRWCDGVGFIRRAAPILRELGVRSHDAALRRRTCPHPLRGRRRG
jgi:hypothetical protein